MNAILLTSRKDTHLLKGDEISGIAGAYPIIQEGKSLNLEYFLDYSETKLNLHHVVGEIAVNWYRDEDEHDVFQIKDISIGRLLSYSLNTELSAVLRYYFAFRKYTSKYKKISVSKNIPSSLKFTAKCFPNSVVFFQSQYQFDGHITPSPHWGGVINPPIHNSLSILLRIIQRPFVKYLRNKVLIMNDWTFKKVNHPDCLNFNKFSPLHTFCLRDGHKYREYAEEIFPDALDNKVISRNIKRILLEFDINSSMRDDLTDLFIKVINKEYLESRYKLINVYCSYREMFDYYSPSMVVVPGHEHPFYQAVFGIAKSKKIPTMFIQDGCTFFVDKYRRPKDNNNKDHMPDFFALMGSYVCNLHKRMFRYNDAIVVKISPPVVKTHKINKNKNKNKNNIISPAIIMFPYGLLNSPYCRWDQRYKYIIDVVNVLKSLNYKSIKVKMKSGYDLHKKEEDGLMRALLDKNAHSDVEMVYGEFSNYLDNAKCVVGYIGTSIVESIFRDTPFYVYEPKSLGMTDDFINSSVIIDSSQISRNLVDLKEAVYNQNSLLLDKDKIFDGIDISEIDFTGLVKRFN